MKTEKELNMKSAEIDELVRRLEFKSDSPYFDYFKAITKKEILDLLKSALRYPYSIEQCRIESYLEILRWYNP